MHPSFPAKLLLFGEYSVLEGSDACAFPLENYTGRLIMPGSAAIASLNPEESNLSLKRLLSYLGSRENKKQSATLLHFDRLNSDISSGLAFESTIPRNYGVGSSGALVAALYAAYRKEELSQDPLIVRTHLAHIESAFHSRSSGTDPLVSYLNQPVFIRNGEIQSPGLTLQTLRESLDIVLVDSGRPGMTKSGVATFRSGDFLTKNSKRSFETEYIPLINRIVSLLSAGKTDGIMEEILSVTQSQLRFFHQQFTPEMKLAAEQGIRTREFAIKLCGSGGGGFYLKISNLRTATPVSRLG